MDIDAIRKAYKRYARLYDFYFGLVMHPGREAVIRRMDCRPGDRILEVGVGTGLSLPLYPPGVQVTGIDISPEMLRRAQARKERDGLDHVVALEVMDAERMTFADNTFDKVVAMYVASVVPHPERLVDEMRRVCKPDGRLFIMNHFQHTNPVVGALERLISPLSGLLGFRTDFSMQAFIHDTRLDVIEHQPVNLFGYWSLLQARNNKDAGDDLLAPATA
ncbi:MAG: class I SAM-dependent methyltransferase [Pseudomonadota bacterium]